MTLSRARIEIVTAPPFELQPPFILFWDLDGGELPPHCPPGGDCALFVCSSNSEDAIQSYAFHPTGFLQKPISMESLRNALRRCVHLWWSALERLEFLSDRVRVRIPFYDLVWAEGSRRGCLLHTLRQSIAVREALYSLEERLPKEIFVRCQRSFLVNLCHVRALTGTTLYLSDGTEIPLGRGHKAAVGDAYRNFRRLQDGETHL